MEQQMGPGGVLFALLPLLIMSLPMAVGIWWVCPKIPANRWLWGILSLVPVVNFIAWYVFFFIVIGAVLDKLNSLQRTAPFS